jgi:hypothetical protein
VRDAGDAAPVDTRSWLVLRWPESERADAKLEIDDQVYELSGPGVEADAESVKIAVEPKAHKLWIVRRGYEPYEREFLARAGEIVTLRPPWRAFPETAELTATQPTEGAPTEGNLPAEQPKVGEKPTPPEVSQEEPPVKAKPPAPALSEEERRALADLEALEARYAKAINPVEKLAGAWDFRGAAVALRNISFEEPELTARLTQRREELKRMHELKQKIVAKINEANSTAQ